MMQASGSSAAAAAGAAAGSSSSAIAPAASAYGSSQGSASASQLGGEQSLVVDPRHPSGIIPALQNIVSTVNLGCQLDLKSIAMRARNAEFNPRRFSAVVMRIRDPKTTALIFHSGKMVVTGARSEELSRLAARKYARIIQKLGFSVTFGDFTVQNMVGTADVRFPVLLDGLARDHEDFTSYEPELFPGLIYRMVSPKVVLLIFVSGKVVMTGAKNREHIYEAFEYIYPVLTEYRKAVTHFSNSTPAAMQITAQPSAQQAAAAATKAKRAAIKSEKQAASRKKKADKAAAKSGAAAAATEGAPADPKPAAASSSC